jgi:ribosome recycling factor
VSASDPQTLVISPFDASILEEIRKGITEAQAALNPSTDGQVIRVSIPPLSEERREELIHAMRQKLENGKIMVRQVRHEAMDNIKRNSKDLGEDGVKRLEKEVQSATDDFIGQIDSLGKKKEEELMSI